MRLMHLQCCEIHGECQAHGKERKQPSGQGVGHPEQDRWEYAKNGENDASQ